MLAVSFGGHFGCLHDAPGDVAVVMCGAQGYEELCTQRGWYKLAEMIAARGFPALRFDYAGCGDSLGADTDSARVEAWRGSIRAATAFARERLGARQIVLAGLRLGALLAAEQALEDGGIAGLALLGAPASGRAYAREMQVLASVVGLPPEGVGPWPAIADGFQVGGFRFTEETLCALGALPKLSALIEANGRGPLFALTVEGIAQTHEAADRSLHASMPFENFQSFMVDRIFSRPPVSAWASVTEWLARQWPRDANPTLPSRSLAPAEIAGDGFTEVAASFGPGGQLSGVLCGPEGMRAQSVMILANTGANHHIGWARGMVDLARFLARRGVSSLRFDASGLGNSPALPGRSAQQVYSMEAIADVVATLDWLEAQGFTRFGAVGICSGAHLAFHSAVADPRIGMLAAINFQRFVWPAHLSIEDSVRHVYRPSRSYASKAMDPRTFLRVLKGEVDVAGIAGALAKRLAKTLRSRAVRLAERLQPQNSGSGAAAATDNPRGWMRRLVDRKVSILLVFSSQDAGLDEIDLHFGSPKAFEAMPGVRFATVQDADHNFSPQWARDELFDLVCDFAANPGARG